MSDIKDRLKKATDECIKCFEDWQQNKKHPGVRETLGESLHELRKAAARLEIDIAISERDQKTSKPLPIPPHKSSRRPDGKNDDSDDEQDAEEEKQKSKPRPKKAESKDSDNDSGDDSGNSSGRKTLKTKSS